MVKEPITKVTLVENYYKEKDYDNISNNRRIFRNNLVYRSGICGGHLCRGTPVELVERKISLESMI